MEPQISPTADLLRPQQALDLTEEKTRLENNLRDPEVKNKGVVRQSLHKLNRQIDSQVPRELVGEELDKSVKESKELLEKITDGMLTQEEMRKNPAGAVGAHMRWEKHNKKNIARWKHLQLRINVGTEDPDVANLERHRPVRRSGGFNMDTVQIQGKSIYLPPHDIKSKNHMSDEDREILNKQTEEAMSSTKLVAEAPPGKRKVTVPKE